MLTQEQLKERLSFIGGSDIAAIMGISSYKSAYDVWLEKTTGETKDLSNNPAVQFGNQMESIIREHAEKKYNKKFPPVFKRHPRAEYCAANLDGLSDDNVVLEIKTVGAAKAYKLPDEYRAQIMWQMLASGAKRAIYVSYFKASDDYYYEEIEFNESEAMHMLEVAGRFWDMALKKEWVEIKEPMIDLMKEWEQLKQAKDAATTAFDVVDEKLKEEFLKLNVEEAHVAGHKITMVERKGNVDYKKVPELKGIDLEPYRAPSSKYVKVL